MEEKTTRCPLCDKPLINGRCDDCGFYVDDTVMPNQTKEYYSQRTSSASYPTQNTTKTNPNFNQYSGYTTHTTNTANNAAPKRDYMSEMQQEQAERNIKNTRIVCILLTVFMFFWGFFISMLILSKNGDVKGRKIVGTVFGAEFALIVLLSILNAVVQMF